jgi:signal transduction histidine kinase
MNKMLRVLYVEDDQLFAEIVQAQLVGIADVVVCGTRAEFEQLLDEPLDIVLVDMRLDSDPTLTGEEAIRLSKQKQPATPVIIMTGYYDDTNAAVECMKAGASDYILKDRIGRLRQSVISANHNREQTEKQNQKKHQELVAEWSAGFVHDMRNVLQTVIGGAELLRAQLTKVVDMISKSAQHGGAMIEQLTIFARGNGATFKPVSVVDLFSSIGQFIEGVSFDNIRVAVNILPETKSVLCDPTQVAQVLINLLANARDAVPTHGGEIQLTAQNAEHIEGQPFAVNGPYVLISVADNGCGIPDEALPHVFDPFWTTKGTKGTGMGLAIVKRIVDSHNGAVTMDTGPTGSTFNIFLPAAPS